MGFVESISSVLANSFNFRDRASRSEYWYWSLFLFVVMFFISLFIISTSVSAVSTLTNTEQAMAELILSSGMIFLLFLLLSFIPSLAVTVRRLHDAGFSGWWYFICLVPYIGVFVLLYLTVLPSQNGGNKWGSNPSGDNGTSGLKDIYENAVAKATSTDNPMNSPAVRNMTPRQQQPVMSGAPVTFGKR